MLLRRFLICLLLSLAIPVQGIAGMLVHAPACPMQQSHTSAKGAEGCPMPKCCNDAKTYGKTGNPCKVGQQCQSGYYFPNSLLEVQTPVALSSSVIAHAAPFIPSIDPSGIWRPPALP